MVPNPPGVAYYHRLLTAVRGHNLSAFVTLYHWDLPYDLYQLTLRPFRGVVSGGWTNPALIPHFLDFASLAFREFGAHVARWFTFNEARSFVNLGYELGAHPPFETGLGYAANKVVLLAHAHAVGEFRRQRRGKGWAAAATITMVVCCGAAMPEFVHWKPTAEVVDVPPSSAGIPWTLVPGPNYYGATLVTGAPRNATTPPPPHPWAADAWAAATPAGPPSDVQPSAVNAHGQPLCPWFAGSPTGYRAMIRWLHRRSPPNTAILLTENGFCGGVDYTRPEGEHYYQTHLAAVWAAITIDRAPIIGYTAWSFADNYEWTPGHP